MPHPKVLIENLVGRANDALVYDAENIVNLRAFAVRALVELPVISQNIPEGGLWGQPQAATEVDPAEWESFKVEKAFADPAKR